MDVRTHRLAPLAPAERRRLAVVAHLAGGPTPRLASALAIAPQTLAAALAGGRLQQRVRRALAKRLPEVEQQVGVNLVASGEDAL